jgi:hypothetical protein
MNPTLKPEDIDNMLIYERTTERRSGIERRDGEQMKNRDLHQAAEKTEKPKSSKDNNFVGEFGWPTARL